MTWWILEVAQFLGLVGLAIGLQRLIRRTGKDYVDQLFSHAPAIGAAFVLLADIALYLIFAAYALFNVGLQRDGTVSSGDVEEVIYSVAGIALVIGILHLVNIVFLPLLAGLMHGQRGPGSTGDRGSQGATQLEGRLGTLDVTVTLRQAG